MTRADQQNADDADHEGAEDTEGHGQDDGGDDGDEQGKNRRQRSDRGRGSARRDDDDGGGGDGDVDLAAVAKELGLTPAQARRRLRNAGTWEQRAKDNYEGSQRAQTLEQQMEELRGQIADRDVRDVERNCRMAMTQVNAGIAESGIKPKDVADLLEHVDPMRLLKDGEPDDDAIAKVVKSISRAGGRSAPDNDQGQRGGKPTDMNALLRNFATGR